jgi:hypothetical protein
MGPLEVIFIRIEVMIKTGEKIISKNRDEKISMALFMGSNNFTRRE